MHNIVDHESNDRPTSASQLVVLFNNLMLRKRAFPDNDQLDKEANELAECIIDNILKSYEEICCSYRDIRTNELNYFEEQIWAVLVDCINRYISTDRERVKILDVATGHGRDMLHAQKLGYNIAGTDNCNGFLKILINLYSDGILKTNNIKKCDMRFLDFPDNSFDVVRHNASLVHMPLIGKNYTVDLALNEAFRVLKPNGLLHVLVKKEDRDSLVFYDTDEGIGERIFQYFSHKTINEVITRNGFTIIHISDEIEHRNKNIVNWILIIAQKRNL
jgi:ubiquinone/menaquinone biosynthesis C-methylase UbiE